MSDFKRTSKIVSCGYKKRTDYDHEQFYDIKVFVTNDTSTHFRITLSSSQYHNIEINSDAEFLTHLVEDLQSIIKLSEDKNE